MVYICINKSKQQQELPMGDVEITRDDYEEVFMLHCGFDR